MSRKTFILLAAGVCLHAATPALAGPAARPVSDPAGATVLYAEPPPEPVRVSYSERPNLGGGFIEFLFGGDGARPMPRGRQNYYQQMPAPLIEPQDHPGRQQAMRPPAGQPEPAYPAPDPKYERQIVDYRGPEDAGTIVIDTPNRFLYLVQGDGKAMRYGIGVGRPGFTWAGVKQISAKREWPDWTPPPEMLKRRPDLPRHMVGGPDNPLGARAMYLGSSLYRIHGSNEPWTIGHAVSSGCIRMRNEDVMDLYERVRVGTRVVVI